MRNSPTQSLFSSFLLSLLLTSSFFPSLAKSQGCQTAQNPSCAGVAEFEALCCPAPSVCYWANRDGAASCCPAGQTCNGAGQGYYSSYYYTTPAVVTQVVVYSSTSTTPTLTTHYYTTTTVAGVVTVTTSGGFVLIGTPNAQPTQTVVIQSGGWEFRLPIMECMAVCVFATMWLLL